MLEQAIQKKILKELKHLEIYAYKNITTNKKGVPDIICCYLGRFIAFEVKRPGSKTTDAMNLPK